MLYRLRVANAQALAIIEAALEGVPGSTFGIGLSHNILTASVMAVISVANRLTASRQRQEKSHIELSA